MKAKNEKEFVMMRVKRTTHNKIKKLNINEIQECDKYIPIYDTVENLIEKDMAKKKNLGKV